MGPKVKYLYSNLRHHNNNSIKFVEQRKWNDKKEKISIQKEARTKREREREKNKAQYRPVRTNTKHKIRRPSMEG